MQSYHVPRARVLPRFPQYFRMVWIICTTLAGVLASLYGEILQAIPFLSSLHFMLDSQYAYTRLVWITLLMTLIQWGGVKVLTGVQLGSWQRWAVIWLGADLLPFLLLLLSYVVGLYAIGQVYVSFFVVRMIIVLWLVWLHVPLFTPHFTTRDYRKWLFTCVGTWSLTTLLHLVTLGPYKGSFFFYNYDLKWGDLVMLIVTWGAHGVVSSFFVTKMYQESSIPIA